VERVLQNPAATRILPLQQLQNALMVKQRRLRWTVAM
jgi:hypothetical protein